MRSFIIAAAIAGCVPSAALAVTISTVSFQNGINGYAGTADMRLIQARGANPESSQLGSAVTQYYVDGRVVAEGVVTEPDVQGLIRFSDIIGASAGQVPAGAYILNAGLRLTTGSSELADTTSRVGIARLLQPFDSTTAYSSYGTNGPAYLDGSAKRTTGWLESNVLDNEVRSLRATRIVQDWARGEANHGLAIQYGIQTNQANGWQIKTTGAEAAERPALDVTFVNEPVSVAKFQQGVNGYDGTTMAYVQGGINTTSDIDDLTTDGAFMEQAFLDGPNTAGTSANDQAIIRFDKLFVSGGGNIPDNASIVDAYLSLTTGDGGNAPSGSRWDVREMLADWDTSKTFTSFGGNGPDEAQGEVGAVSDSEIRMLAGSVTRFDLTDLVQAWQGGRENNGLNVQSAGADGWQIHFTGSSVAEARPELTIAYVVPEPTSVAALALGGSLLGRRRRR